MNDPTIAELMEQIAKLHERVAVLEALRPQSCPHDPGWWDTAPCNREHTDDPIRWYARNDFLDWRTR